MAGAPGRRSAMGAPTGKSVPVRRRAPKRLISSVTALSEKTAPSAALPAIFTAMVSFSRGLRRRRGFATPVPDGFIVFDIPGNGLSALGQALPYRRVYAHALATR